MSLRIRLLLLLAVLLTTTIGCSLVESPKAAARRMKRTFTPNPTDWDTGSAEDAGEWDFVGDEGRAGQAREKDPDPWFKRFFMSEKANSIERNLGYD